MRHYNLQNAVRANATLEEKDALHKRLYFAYVFLYIQQGVQSDKVESYLSAALLIFAECMWRAAR